MGFPFHNILMILLLSAKWSFSTFSNETFEPSKGNSTFSESVNLTDVSPYVNGNNSKPLDTNQVVLNFPNTSNIMPSSLFIGHASAHTCGIKDKKSNSSRPYRILMSSTDKYINVLLNWLIFFHQLCPDRSNIYFLCLDKVTETVMTKYGLTCAYAHHTVNNNNKIWLMRTRITKQLLDQGFDVLMSDSDAIWLRNPFEVLENFESADIIGSRASFPDDVSKVLGATFCMGFMYVKATKVNQVIWEELSNSMMKEQHPDDQRSFNRLLLRNKLIYDTKPKYLNTTAPNKGKMQFRGNELRVSLLPHESFRRVCEGLPKATIQKSIVVHCLSEKTGAAKEKGGVAHGVWQVHQKWIDVEFDGNLDHFLENIMHDKSRRLLPCAEGAGDVWNAAMKRIHSSFQSRSFSYASCSTAVYTLGHRWNISALDRSTWKLLPLVEDTLHHEEREFM